MGPPSEGEAGHARSGLRVATRARPLQRAAPAPQIHRALLSADLCHSREISCTYAVAHQTLFMSIPEIEYHENLSSLINIQG